MNTLSTERIDQLALVWLAMRPSKTGPAAFADLLQQVVAGADDRKRLAGESVARLRGRGMILPRRCEITEAGHREALELLGVSGIPKTQTKKLEWAKKMLLLRTIGIDPTGAVGSAGKGEFLAAQVVAHQHKLDRKMASPTSVLAVLAWRALAMEDKPTFAFDDVFASVFLAGGPAIESLRLADRELPEFASLVTDAARSSVTGRWHDAVFISHVWNTLQGRGDVGITFEKFKRRLVEAYQNDLVELSRADLVEAMPAADVSASETVHSGARFHFVRVEHLAS